MTPAERLSALLTERGLMSIHAVPDCAANSADCVGIKAGERWELVRGARSLRIDDPATQGILFAMLMGLAPTVEDTPGRRWAWAVVRIRVVWPQGATYGEALALALIAVLEGE